MIREEGNQCNRVLSRRELLDRGRPPRWYWWRGRRYCSPSHRSRRPNCTGRRTRRTGTPVWAWRTDRTLIPGSDTCTPPLECPEMPRYIYLYPSEDRKLENRKEEEKNNRIGNLTRHKLHRRTKFHKEYSIRNFLYRYGTGNAKIRCQKCPDWASEMHDFASA